jgi:hypothetical protein
MRKGRFLDESGRDESSDDLKEEWKKKKSQEIKEMIRPKMTSRPSWKSLKD